MKLHRGLAAAAFLAFLHVPGDAQATIKLKDGSSVTGRGTRYDSENRTLYFHADDGRDLVLTLNDLDGRSAYLVNRSIAPQDDAERQLAVANFARDVELFAHSNRHYEYALKAADASFKPQVEREQATMFQRAAAWGMARAEAALKKGDSKEAEKWLQKIIKKLPDEPQAAQAATMLDGIYDEVHGARDDHLETASPQLLTTDLAKGKKYYDSMLEKNKSGLLQKSNSRSKRDYNSAIKDGKKALKEIEKVAKKRTDVSSQNTLDGYHKLVTDQIIEIHMNIASQLLAQSSFNAAMKEVNAALALDSKSSAALSMRARVENASSRGIGWW